MKELLPSSPEKRPLAGKAFTGHCPSTVHICLTDRCNLTCRHCDIWKNTPGNELDLEAWKKIIDEFREWIGPFSLKFAGGEPLVRRDIVELTRYCRDNEITVGINTNGTLINKKMAVELLDAGINELNVSLDGIDPEIHDYIRNKQGTFDRVMKAVKYFEGANSTFKLNLATIVCEQNLDNLMDLLNWTKSNHINTITFQALFQNFGAKYNPNWFEENDLFPFDVDRVNDVFEKIFEFKMRRGLISNPLLQLSLMRAFFNNPRIQCGQECRAGASDVAVDATGNMLLCFNLAPIGKVTEDSPESLYTAPIAWERRREVSRCRRSCSLLNCNFSRF